MFNKCLIVFSHGKESGPNGVKIKAMTEVANNLGIETVSLDYQGMDDPKLRIEKLVSYVQAYSRPIILVGSSMGAYVSLKASQKLNLVGLFLLAPAVFMPGYELKCMSAVAKEVFAIHGWHDEIVPVANAIRFAQQQDCGLLLLDDDHVLRNSLLRICHEFSAFLERLDELN